MSSIFSYFTIDQKYVVFSVVRFSRVRFDFLFGDFHLRFPLSFIKWLINLHINILCDELIVFLFHQIHSGMTLRIKQKMIRVTSPMFFGIEEGFPFDAIWDIEVKPRPLMRYLWEKLKDEFFLGGSLLVSFHSMFCSVLWCIWEGRKLCLKSIFLVVNFNLSA